MNCPSCGNALAQQLKYCNRCGAQLSLAEDTRDVEVIKVFEKRMDSEMEGLFWITVLGVALILGGMVLLTKAQLSQWLIVAYMILSSAAFITYFGLGLWQVRRLAQSINDTKEFPRPVETKELTPAEDRTAFQDVPSVVEHTTRTLKAAPGEQIRR